MTRGSTPPTNSPNSTPNTAPSFTDPPTLTSSKLLTTWNQFCKALKWKGKNTNSHSKTSQRPSLQNLFKTRFSRPCKQEDPNSSKSTSDNDNGPDGSFTQLNKAASSPTFRLKRTTASTKPIPPLRLSHTSSKFASPPDSPKPIRPGIPVKSRKKHTMLSFSRLKRGNQTKFFTSSSNLPPTSPVSPPDSPPNSGRGNNKSGSSHNLPEYATPDKPWTRQPDQNTYEDSGPSYINRPPPLARLPFPAVTHDDATSMNITEVDESVVELISHDSILDGMSLAIERTNTTHMPFTAHVADAKSKNETQVGGKHSPQRNSACVESPWGVKGEFKSPFTTPKTPRRAGGAMSLRITEIANAVQGLTGRKVVEDDISITASEEGKPEGGAISIDMMEDDFVDFSVGKPLKRKGWVRHTSR